MSAAGESARVVDHGGAFRHEALLYSGREEFLAGTVPFVREGLRAGEPVLVAVPAERATWLREALGADADDACFEDIERLGRNPARLIALWRGFAESHADAAALRGVGEPAWAGRDPAALDECARHEALINAAFDDSRDFWLLCPYDVNGLPGEAIAAARQTHPLLRGRQGNGGGASPDYLGHGPVLDGTLPPAPPGAATLEFDGAGLRAVRHFADDAGRALGLAGAALGDLVYAAAELAANSVRHGGGAGTARIWGEDDSVVVEVTDSGLIADPMVGRLRPRLDQVAGRGMWLVNQLCDLVQIRSGPAGTTVRARIGRPDAG